MKSTFEKLYADWTQNRWAAALAQCSDKFTFQIAGKSRVAGKFNRESFATGYGAQLQELSGGTYQLEIHDILVSDVHATVLGTAKVVRGGKTLEYRTVHVWRTEGGKPLAGYEYPRDLYQYDEIWG